jgi:Ca2+-binding EF-hand superfamily protein
MNGMGLNDLDENQVQQCHEWFQKIDQEERGTVGKR